MKQRRRNNKYPYTPLLEFSLFLFVLSFLCAGCASSTTSNPTLDSAQKGPGDANLRATALSRPVPTICPAFHAVPASTSGWKIYQDTSYPFHLSYPPDWRAGSYLEASGNDYIVQLFPPGSTTPVGIATRDPEHMQISLLLVGTVSAPATDSNWNVETTSLRINGTGTVVYARSSPSCEEVDRIAVVHAGQHYFTYFLKSTQAKGRQDVALFLAMLQSFVYVG